MSKPRYNWWPFVLAIIRDYPDRCKRLKDLRQQSTVANNSGMPKGGGSSRAAENVATRQLPRQEHREYEAVHRAWGITATMKNGKIRQEIISLTMWKGYHVDGAALLVHESPSTTRRYRWQFIMLVAHMYGFLDAEEYAAAIKKDVAKKILECQSQKNVQ